MTTEYYIKECYKLLDHLFVDTKIKYNYKIITNPVSVRHFYVKFPEYRVPLEIFINEENELDFTGPNDLINLLINYINDI